MFRYGYRTVSREDGQTRLSREIFLGERFLARLGKGPASRPLCGSKWCPRRSSLVWPSGKADNDRNFLGFTELTLVCFAVESLMRRRSVKRGTMNRTPAFGEETVHDPVHR